MVFAQFFSPAFIPTPAPLLSLEKGAACHAIWSGTAYTTYSARTPPCFSRLVLAQEHTPAYINTCVCASLRLYLESVYAYNMEYMFFSIYLNRVSRRGTERRPRLFATCRLRPPSRSHGRFCPEDVRWDGRRTVLPLHWGPSMFCRRLVTSAPPHIFQPQCGMG
jgi:hypothetical protein